MPVPIDTRQLLTSLACALTASVAVNVVLGKTFSTILSALRRYLSRPDGRGIKVPVLKEASQTPHTPQTVSRSLSYLSPLQRPKNIIPLPPIETTLQLFDDFDPQGPRTPWTYTEELSPLSPIEGLERLDPSTPTENSLLMFASSDTWVPATPRIPLQELPPRSPSLRSEWYSPRAYTGGSLLELDVLEPRAPSVRRFVPQSPYHRSEWYSSTIPIENTLLEFDSPSPQSSSYDYFGDSETQSLFQPSSSSFTPSASTPTPSIQHSHIMTPYTTTESNDIVINMTDALTTKITIYGTTYDPTILRGHLEYLNWQSNEHRETIDLDIVAACEKTADAYHAIEEIVYLCKDHIGSLSIAVDGCSTHLDVLGAELRPRTPEAFTLPHLRHFSWAGDANCLPRPWGSLSNLPFAQLESLSLDCRLSVSDCAQILSSCERIVRFSATSIQDCMPVLCCGDVYKVLKNLRSLKLRASVNLAWLFDTISILGLQEVDFKFGPGTNQNLDEFRINWTNVRTCSLQCSLSEARLEAIQRKCSSRIEYTQTSAGAWRD